MFALLRQRNYALLFWSGLVSHIGRYALAGPFAQAALPHIVRADELTRANALFSTAVLLGSPLGGPALQHIGLPAVVLIDSVSFAVPAAATPLIDVPLEDRRKQHTRTRGRVHHAVADLVFG